MLTTSIQYSSGFREKTPSRRSDEHGQAIGAVHSARTLLLARDPCAPEEDVVNDEHEVEKFRRNSQGQEGAQDAFRASMALRMENVVEELARRSRGCTPL